MHISGQSAPGPFAAVYESLHYRYFSNIRPSCAAAAFSTDSDSKSLPYSVINDARSSDNLPNITNSPALKSVAAGDFFAASIPKALLQNLALPPIAC